MTEIEKGTLEAELDILLKDDMEKNEPRIKEIIDQLTWIDWSEYNEYKDYRKNRTND